MSFDFDLEPTFLELHERCREATMTSVERMYALYQATNHVLRRGIPGALVECGVWRGGSAMLMCETLRRAGATDRDVWLYDTFDGMTAPGDRDVQAMSGRPAAALLAERSRDEDDPFWGLAPRPVVEANLARTGYPPEHVQLVEGDVRETLPAQAPEAVALLRLDTDWYDSTRHELEHLYPRISPGGVLIIDDYGYWEGARHAVDEYLATLSSPPLLVRVDYTGRVGVKA